MKKILVLIVAALMALIVAIPVMAADLPAGPVTANLVMDGRDTAAVAGTVGLVYDEGVITVTYTVNPETNDGWALSETHIYVDANRYPTKSAPGKFPYVAVPTANPNVWTCTVPLTPNPGQVVYVAAHAALTKTIETPGDPPIITVLSETGWAQVGSGYDVAILPGKNWATYFGWAPVD